MNKATHIIFFVSILLVCSPVAYTQTVSVKDFKNAAGSWEGSLTYLDYSSGKPYTMPANIVIKRIKKTNKFILSNLYPNEASANNTDTLVISSDGKYIGSERVKSRIKNRAGELEIVTEEQGTDGNDNRQATFRFTYTISKSLFKKRKDVQFSGENKWINRHEYSYKKKT